MIPEIKPIVMPKADVKPGQSTTFVIDWTMLREVLSGFAFHGRHPAISRPSNIRMVNQFLKGGSWYGYSGSDIREWLTKGYETDFLGGISVDPIREKRRYIYSEDAEEMHIDRALSGEDNYAGEWTRRVIIPGMSIEAEIMFAASTKAQTVVDYNVFICRTIQSLEMSGIDCEVTLNFSSDEMVHGFPKTHTIVRVKKENEASDFGSFSAMLSPAAFRGFGFCALVLHADSIGRDASMSLGRGRRQAKQWAITKDEKSQKILIDCPYAPAEFPKLKMHDQLSELLGV